MLASSSTFWPSIVTAGVWRRRESRPRSSSPWRCLKPYSARMMGEGSTIITPASPSMIDPVVLAHQLAGAARADHGRDVHAARDDRGVRVAAADVGDEAGEHALLELQHVGRRQVVRDQHQRHVHAVVQQQVLLGLALAAGSAAPSAKPRPSCSAGCARPPAPGRPCARAGTRPPCRRTGATALPAAWSAPTRRCRGGR